MWVVYRNVYAHRKRYFVNNIGRPGKRWRYLFVALDLCVEDWSCVFMPRISYRQISGVPLFDMSYTRIALLPNISLSGCFSCKRHSNRWAMQAQAVRAGDSLTWYLSSWLTSHYQANPDPAMRNTAWRNPDICTYINTCIYTYIQTYIHAYVPWAHFRSIVGLQLRAFSAKPPSELLPPVVPPSYHPFTPMLTPIASHISVDP